MVVAVKEANQQCDCKELLRKITKSNSKTYWYLPYGEAIMFINRGFKAAQNPCLNEGICS
jgi:hypothetical protein